MKFISKIKKLIANRKRLEEFLFYPIVGGVLLISLGVYLMGSGINRLWGRNILILGSGMFYFSVIIFAWIIE